MSTDIQNGPLTSMTADANPSSPATFCQRLTKTHVRAKILEVVIMALTCGSSVAGAVSWFSTSEWAVSGHRNGMSQVFGIGAGLQGTRS